MPDLAALPSGTSVFVDTNIIVYHFRGQSATCDVFLERVARGEVVAYVNTQVLSDLLHKLMLAEAAAKSFISSPGAGRLKAWLQADRTRAKQLVDYQTQFEQTLKIGLRTLSITRRLLVSTKKERSSLGLMTGDSLHLGNMNRYKIPLRNIVTRDGDFAHCPGITVWQPLDI